MKKVYRFVVDGIVIVTVLLFLLPTAYDYFFYEYSDETLPDDVIALDASIDEYLTYIEPNFQTLYTNQATLPAPSLTPSGERRVYTDAENYKKNAASVVYITTEDEFGDLYFGSGTILTEDGVILTSYHNVEGARKVVVSTHTGVNYEVTGVLAADVSLDVIFLKIDAEDLSPVSIGDSDALEVGDKTLVIGHPEGLINTLSVGNVAGVRQYNGVGHGTQIQITNSISSGNSGGGVFNQYGELVAVPSWSIEYEYNTVQVQNLNFATPINTALELLRN